MILFRNGVVNQSEIRNRKRVETNGIFPRIPIKMVANPVARAAE